jgi:hypothetical protein
VHDLLEIRSPMRDKHEKHHAHRSAEATARLAAKRNEIVGMPPSDMAAPMGQ